MTQLLMCSKCGLTGDDLERCGNIGSIGCPDPVLLDPTKVVLLRCGPCDKVRALPVDDIMHPERTIQRRASVCQFQKCNAVVVLPEPSPQPPQDDAHVAEGAALFSEPSQKKPKARRATGE